MCQMFALWSFLTLLTSRLTVQVSLLSPSSSVRLSRGQWPHSGLSRSFWPKLVGSPADGYSLCGGQAHQGFLSGWKVSHTPASPCLIVREPLNNICARQRIAQVSNIDCRGYTTAHPSLSRFLWRGSLPSRMI